MQQPGETAHKKTWRGLEMEDSKIDNRQPKEKVGNKLTYIKRLITW